MVAGELQFKDLSAKYLAFAENEIEKAVARGTIRVQREAQRLTSQFSGPTKGNPGASSSKPGESPHKRTGTLTRSIDQETFRKGSKFLGRVGSNLDYALFLEIGGRTPHDEYARPFLRPALDSQRKRIVEEIKAAGKRLSRAQ